MPLREDLTYEKRKTETPYIFTGARDIDGALDKAYYAILDAQKFREHAKATGVDVVRKDISLAVATGCFAAGVAFCVLVLGLMGVI